MFSELISNVLSKRKDYLEDLAELEKTIRDYLSTNEAFSILEPFILNKGKRIRSILYFINLGSEKTTVQKYKTIALIEIIHFASIMHDDVIDNNFLRRNGVSFLKEYGKKKSILFGDFLLVKAINELLRLHSKDNLVKNFCLREFSATAYGAVLEQMLSAKSSLQECLRVASLKTGTLFKLSCFLGKYLSSEDFKKAKQAAVHGLCFGTIFQIQNDIDSYKPEKCEDSEDYMQKNITLPLLILRDHFGFDISAFYDSSQEGYDEIKNFIFSHKFENIAKSYLSNLEERALPI